MINSFSRSCHNFFYLLFDTIISLFEQKFKMKVQKN
nr:MAG TPA: Nse4 C-terminal [Caudoviricetes sp.]